MVATGACHHVEYIQQANGLASIWRGWGGEEKSLQFEYMNLILRQGGVTFQAEWIE